VMQCLISCSDDKSYDIIDPRYLKTLQLVMIPSTASKVNEFHLGFFFPECV